MNIFLRLSTFLLVFLMSWTFVQAQINSTTVLASAKMDGIFLLENQLKTSLEDRPQKLPFVDKLEFRTEFNEFDIRRQEYAIRMSHHSIAEREEQKKLYNATLQIADSETKLRLFSALEDRYTLLVAAKFAKSFRVLSSDLILILEDQKTVVENQLQLGLNDDLSRLIDMEEELQDEALSVLELEQLKTKTNRKIESWLQQPATEIDWSNFISIEKIKAQIALIDESSIDFHPSIIRGEMRTNLSQQEAQLERAQKKSLLNFLQVRYGDNPRDLLKERFSIGAGIQIPTKTAATLKIKELEMEALESATEVKRDKLELQSEQTTIKNELEFLFEKWDLMKSQLNTYQQNYAPEKLLQKGIVNPTVLLKIKERILKKQFLIQKTELDIFEKYIELLATSGKMMETPLKNYLSEGLEEF